MNLEYLKNFLCFAEYLSFTKAAENLYMVQTTLGRQIRSLEEQIGSKLYTRDKHPMELTDAGVFLVSEGKKLLQQTEKLELRMRQIGEENSLKLTIASIPVNLHCFSSIYSNFYKMHPNVSSTLLYKELGEISPLVTSGDADIGLTYFFEMDEISNFDEQIEVYTIGRDHLCVLVNKNHCFAASGRCTIEELRSEHLLCFNYPAISRAKRHHYHAKFTPVEETSSFLKNRETMLLQVNAGMGITLMPYEEAKIFGSDLIIVEVDDYVMEHDIILIWKKSNENPAFHLFLNSLQKT